MKYRQGRVLEALRSAQEFLDRHGDTLDTINKSGARTNLDAVATELQAHAVKQDGGKRRAIGETAHQRELRLGLRFAMRPIAEAAGARLRATPQFAALRLPSYRLRGMAMVAAAHAMADAVTPYTAIMVEAGLPADFIEQLRRAADALSESYDERRGSQSASKGATQGLTDAERRGRSTLRILDALVVPALGHDEALLTAWRAARRIRQKPGPAQEQGDGPAGGTPDGGSPASGGAPVPLLPAAPDAGAAPAEGDIRDGRERAA